MALGLAKQRCASYHIWAALPLTPTPAQFLNFGKRGAEVCASAEAARIRAEERLQHKQSMHEYYQSKIALNRAMQRLQATAKYNR